MTTSSEDVLLQVGQVRYKKGDGTLYVMNERLAWMMDHRDTVSVSHRYTDIKTQKISPEGKPKIQLQVCLHDGTSSTFHFVNRLGQGAQVKDRDDVKELLQQLLQKFKCEVNKELEEKNRLLSQNPSLLQLYRDLVITHVISSEEFWSQHAMQYMQKQQNQKQDIGVSGAFLADIKPQTDGCNGLKYNLTSDIIECIFKTYPAVRKKHLEYVPHKLTESEFWTKFFQSHYFHRDRINAGSKDLFTECAKLDDQELKRDISAGIEDPLVDITSFEDKTLDEGYGTGGDRPVGVQSGNIVHQSMIKRFNQHSIMVLKACQQNTTCHSGSEPLDSSVLPMKQPSQSSERNPDCSDYLRTAKKLRIQEKLVYDDLESDSKMQNVGTQLSLSRVERYLHGPMPGSSEDVLSDDVFTVSTRLQREAEGWCSVARLQASTLVNPAAAVSALGELTPGGALMKGFEEESLAQLVPADLERELKNLYMSLCELFRHFWTSFPPTTPTLEAKAVRMHEALHRFHSARLKPFENRVLREFSPLSQHLTSHLNQMLNSAYRKFATWQQRKMQTLR
ncbi:general transcription factor IIH subunit 1 isoform X2 [Zootermopsis nevadensis]|uniref:General transcription factor IIH subunit 1 n=1 Tax=Zootermopsis nevadensis TaxID=136037 RepID=A0A067RJ16_ZOONE|nr:general transcription factor IIH subunit 1 isoform X1 [Zootermopsis nevadensis]XP_021920222.1 general transcription factor IIH subunit 1 isoform X1 [Zootermopsis nevadensis]XP_021920223.1 general transcription factor IIH subunit 1 isoform X1 [Zootermopsis nevadensis]XP_021920224.1 general transcription factor IIH subunit 1 isoform X2 [Zootermopsis nevadensis]KDR19295.1 General transcription factor IIH subunit 1 [Zootermopsis nevadensis]